jgi:hypothetical protein
MWTHHVGNALHQRLFTVVVESEIQSTSENWTIRFSNVDFSDDFWVRFSNAKDAILHSKTGQIRPVFQLVKLT